MPPGGHLLQKSASCTKKGVLPARRLRSTPGGSGVLHFSHRAWNDHLGRDRQSGNGPRVRAFGRPLNCDLGYWLHPPVDCRIPLVPLRSARPDSNGGTHHRTGGGGIERPAGRETAHWSLLRCLRHPTGSPRGPILSGLRGVPLSGMTDQQGRPGQVAPSGMIPDERAIRSGRGSPERGAAFPSVRRLGQARTVHRWAALSGRSLPRRNPRPSHPLRMAGA